jgi:hypothetical protein
MWGEKSTQEMCMVLMLSAVHVGTYMGVWVVVGHEEPAQRQSRGDTTHLFPHCTSSLAAMVCGPVGMHAYMLLCDTMN